MYFDKKASQVVCTCKNVQKTNADSQELAAPVMLPAYAGAMA